MLTFRIHKRLLLFDVSLFQCFSFQFGVLFLLPQLFLFSLLPMSSDWSNIFSDTAIPASLKIKLQVVFIPIWNYNVAILTTNLISHGESNCFIVCLFVYVIVPCSKQLDIRARLHSVFFYFHSQLKVIRYPNDQKVIVPWQQQLVVTGF